MVRSGIQRDRTDRLAVRCRRQRLFSDHRESSQSAADPDSPRQQRRVDRTFRAGGRRCDNIHLRPDLPASLLALNLTARAATIATLLLVVLCGFPSATRADSIFMPFIGSTFARETVFNIGAEPDESSKHVIFGGSASWLSAGLLGVEGEFAYSPSFFKVERPGSDIQSSKLFTLSGSVI